MSYYVSLFCCFVSIGFMMLRNVEKRHSGYWRKPMYGWGVRKCVDMAKWGCVIECLAQKYYIEDDTDAILEEIDAALVAHWKRIEKIHAEVTTVYLWLGYYFLLRFRNRESRSHSRCKQIMSSLLCALVEIFRKVEKGGAPTEVLSHLSVDVWGETVCWMEQVHDSRLCEKQSSALLAQLYNLKSVELEKGLGKQDALLQQILEFYCF
jgi:hypothetical protein